MSRIAAAKALRLGPQLKELRIHLCQKSIASEGVRNFIENYYVPIKENNPKFPILVRECKDVYPMVYARYEFGEERSLPLNKLNSDQVLDVITKLSSEKK